MFKSAIIIPYQRIILALLPLLFCSMLYAQKADTTPIVRTIDLTGKNPWAAMKGAIDASRNDVIVVLVRGGTDVLNDKVKGQLKALIQSGYDRIGFIIADLLPNEYAPIISIISDGTLYASIPDAKPTTRMDYEVFNLVKDAYAEHITPKLNPKAVGYTVSILQFLYRPGIMGK